MEGVRNGPALSAAVALGRVGLLPCPHEAMQLVSLNFSLG